MATKLMTLVEVDGKTTKATVELSGGLTVTVEGDSADAVFALLGKIATGPSELDVSTPRRRTSPKKNKEIDAEVLEFAFKEQSHGVTLKKLRESLGGTSKKFRKSLKRLERKGKVKLVSRKHRPSGMGRYTDLWKHEKFAGDGEEE